MQASNATTRTVAIQTCSLLIAGLLSSPSWAHPGHGVGGGDWSLAHYLTEPDHIAAALGLALLVAAFFAGRAIRARRATQAR
jgi:hydrogenase/urease accessory protein HupE